MFDLFCPIGPCLLLSSAAHSLLGPWHVISLSRTFFYTSSFFHSESLSLMSHSSRGAPFLSFLPLFSSSITFFLTGPGTFSVAQAGLELEILLAQPWESWDHGHAPLQLQRFCFSWAPPSRFAQMSAHGFIVNLPLMNVDCKGKGRPFLHGCSPWAGTALRTQPSSIIV